MKGEPCERCSGTGRVFDTMICPVCLGLGTFVRAPSRPQPEYHLIALHDPVAKWEEVVAMLPVREAKENWDE